MGLASDPRYRSVSLSWKNNAALGSETVQIFARPLGGDWGLVASVPVGGDNQLAEWDTALPLTEYAIAMRFVNVHTPGAGYESDDPDDWDAPTAPGARTSMQTSAEAPTSISGVYNTSTGKLALSWVCAQVGLTYQLEKNAGAGWVTVADDIGTTSYQYTPGGGEVGTTVQFRVRGINGAILGGAFTQGVYVGVVVGAVTGLAATWNYATGKLDVSWDAADQATSYLLELRCRHDGQPLAWQTLATPSGTSVSVSPLAAPAGLIALATYEGINAPGPLAAVPFELRITGKNGSVSGPTSAAIDVDFASVDLVSLEYNAPLVKVTYSPTNVGDQYTKPWVNVFATVSDDAGVNYGEVAAGGGAGDPHILFNPSAYGLSGTLRIRVYGFNGWSGNVLQIRGPFSDYQEIVVP